MHWIAPSEKDAATDTLEKRLWAAAGQLRANSGLIAQEYSGPILGIIFLHLAAKAPPSLVPTFVWTENAADGGALRSRSAPRVGESAGDQERSGAVLQLSPEAPGNLGCSGRIASERMPLAALFCDSDV